MKKTSKKSTPKKSVKKVVMERPMMGMIPEPKRVTVEKAEGGFIVRKGYSDKQHIAKTIQEAQKIQEKLLK